MTHVKLLKEVEYQINGGYLGQICRIVSLTENVTFFFLTQHSPMANPFSAGPIVEIPITKHFQTGMAK